MSEKRYFGRVVHVLNKLEVVIDKGAEHGVNINDKFIVVGLGPMIVDPDTGEDIEQLEIVRGRVFVSHVQNNIATARSYEVKRTPDTREIKKTTSRVSGLISLLGPQDSTTESIKPGAEETKELSGVKIGDLLIKLG